MPAHSIAQELIRRTGAPLAAPSANLSGRPSPTSVDAVLEDLNGKIAAVLEGGSCQYGIESTVILLPLKGEVILLRKGVIEKTEIEKVLSRELKESQKGDLVLSPGMKYRHYAPNAPIRLFFSREALEEYLIGPREKKAMVLVTQKFTFIQPLFFLCKEELYLRFRQADRENFSEILILCTPDVIAQEGLYNRICKAAAL